MQPTPSPLCGLASWPLLGTCLAPAWHLLHVTWGVILDLVPKVAKCSMCTPHSSEKFAGNFAKIPTPLQLAYCRYGTGVYGNWKPNKTINPGFHFALPSAEVPIISAAPARFDLVRGVLAMPFVFTETWLAISPRSPPQEAPCHDRAERQTIQHRPDARVLLGYSSRFFQKRNALRQ